MSYPLLIAGRRSAIGKYQGGLTPVRADDLAATVLAGLYQKLVETIPGLTVDELILGCANQAGEDSRNVCRQVGLLAGLPASVPASTVNQLCGSSMVAVIQAVRAIRCGEATFILAGGLEHMSRAPLAKLPPWVESNPVEESTVFGWRFTNPRFVAESGLNSACLTMIEAAEYTATTCQISRNAQETMALASHQRAAVAWQAGFHASSLCPLDSPDPQWQNRDECLRPNASAQGLGRLPPLLPQGSVTAATAASFADGAAWVAIADSQWLEHLPADTLALEIRTTATVACSPREMGLAPATAVQRILNTSGLSLADLDLMEWHEAFAATHLASCQALDWDWQDPRLNGWGGSLALGAPMGMIGARLLVTLLDRFREAPSANWGLVVVPVGMGQAHALLLRRLEPKS